MKEVLTIVQSWCDHPECVEERAGSESVDPQETTTVEVWFYAHAKGRKTNPVPVDLCVNHLAELRDLYAALRKFDQKEVS